MPTAACARCGRQVDEGKLLFSDVGRICGTCEAELGEEEDASSARWALAAGGPLMAFSALIALLAGFFPVIGVFTVGISPFLAILALVLGARAFLAAGEADGPERTVLVLCGALAVPGGAVVLALSLLTLVSMLLSLGGRGIGWWF